MPWKALSKCNLIFPLIRVYSELWPFVRMTPSFSPFWIVLTSMFFGTFWVKGILKKLIFSKYLRNDRESKEIISDQGLRYSPAPGTLHHPAEASRAGCAPGPKDAPLIHYSLLHFLLVSMHILFLFFYFEKY